MISNHAFQAIAELDLEPIKKKLMHPSAGEGWSAARADAIATEYRRFMYIVHTYPDELASPTVDVDTFWHYHILDTMKYAADCEKAFGYFMHHYPYLGLMEEDEEGMEERAAECTRKLYEATFGEQYDTKNGRQDACLQESDYVAVNALEDAEGSGTNASLLKGSVLARCTTWCTSARPAHKKANAVARCTTWCTSALPALKKASAVSRCTTWCTVARPQSGNAAAAHVKSGFAMQPCMARD